MEDAVCIACVDSGKRGKDVLHSKQDCPLLSYDSDEDSGMMMSQDMERRARPVSEPPKTCGFCHGHGHGVRECQVLANRMCKECGGKGHTEKYCRNKNRRRGNNTHRDGAAPILNGPSSAYPAPSTHNGLSQHEIRGLRSMLQWAERSGIIDAYGTLIPSSIGNAGSSSYYGGSASSSSASSAHHAAGTTAPYNNGSSNPYGSYPSSSSSSYSQRDTRPYSPGQSYGQGRQDNPYSSSSYSGGNPYGETGYGDATGSHTAVDVPPTQGDSAHGSSSAGGHPETESSYSFT